MLRRCGAARPLLRWLLLASAICGHGLAWRTAGVLPTEGVFAVYAGKFCFDYKKGVTSEAGRFEVSMSGRVVPGQQGPGLPGATDGPPCWGQCETQGNMYLAVFDDEDDHWAIAQARWSELTCEELLHYASFNISLSALDSRDGGFNRTVYVHETSKPRFWYFVFAACGVSIASPVTYEIHGENILQGLESEFGIDELGSLQLQFLGAVAFLLTAIALRAVAKNATGAEALRSRPLLRLLQLSTLCSAAGAASLSFHYAIYMIDGWGVTLFEVVGQAFVCAAKASLTLLQLLAAKGWALFYAPAEFLQRRLTFCMIGCIMLTSIACEIHADYFHDWSTALYLYQSWPGQIILVLNVLLFMEAWRSMRDTYRHESSTEVRVFYAVISVASLLYFLTLPTLCILASAFVPYDRAKYTMRAEVASRFAATVLLFFCLRPSRLDAMVNARLEAGLDTVGEMRDDIEEDGDADIYADEDGGGYREASEDVPDRLAERAGAHPLLGDELPAE